MSCSVHSMGGTMPAEWRLLPPDTNPRIVAHLGDTSGGDPAIGKMEVHIAMLISGPALIISTEQKHPMGGDLPSVYAVELGEMLQHMVEQISLGIISSIGEG